jgi:hypothetical protein
MIQSVNNIRTIFSLALAAAFMASAAAATAQQSFYERFRAHNAHMTGVQPTWMGPMIQLDSRLTQSARISFSNSYTPARTHTVNYGNYHTVGLIFGDRVQVNLIAPPYIQNNYAPQRDGFGDAQVETKYRIASGNAEHGNYALTAKLTYNAPAASHQNGAATTVLVPTLAAGRAWGRFDVQTALGGVLPTGKIAVQGRAVEWNTTAQVLAGEHLWLDVEDNALFNRGGPFDGKTQNFLTPAAFYTVRRKEWKPTHAVVVLGLGMQIATSRFYFYNHNLIPEVRILF